MKKLLLLISLAALLTGCSKDKTGGEQDYTSFVVWHNDTETHFNCVVACEKDGTWYEVAKLGDLARNKFSKKIVVRDEAITTLYFYVDRLYTDVHGNKYRSSHKCNESYDLKPNKHNTILINPKDAQPSGIWTPAY